MLLGSMLQQDVYMYITLLFLTAALLAASCDAAKTDTLPADGGVHSGWGEDSFRSENIFIIINAEEFRWYTVASVGAMVTVILCMKFLALYMVLLPKNGRHELKLLFRFYAYTSSEWCDTAYSTVDNVFLLISLNV